MEKKFNDKGEELMDPTPAAVPVGFKRPPTLAEQVQRLVRNQLSRMAGDQGYETFEEAEDFDVGDDYDPSSPHELEFDPLLNKEISKPEKAFLEAHRREFEQFVAQKKKQTPASAKTKAKKKAVKRRPEPEQTDIEDYIDDED